MNGASRPDDLKAYIRAQGWQWQPGKPIVYGEQIRVGWKRRPHPSTSTRSRAS